MRSPLPRLARNLNIDERRLRRAVEVGLVRAARPSPRRLEISAEEIRYLRSHWDLLSAVREALRVEPMVRLAAVYGSIARGEDDQSSDLDLLVDLADPDPLALSALNVRLRRRLGRDVDVAALDRAVERSPGFLLEVLNDGRPVVDRDDQWKSLLANYPRLVREAEAEMRTQRAATSQALDCLNELAVDRADLAGATA